MVGISAAEPSPNHYLRYLDWIRKGFAADMRYMTAPDKVEKRGDLNKVLPGVKSVISLAFAYPNVTPSTSSDVKFARYGLGDDYHEVLKSKLTLFIDWMLKNTSVVFVAKSYVDTGPILERALAEKSGLGWIGKNTCLINDTYGSYLFLCEILTTLELSYDSPGQNHCGTCTRCLDACPTHALEAPYQLNASKCISYHTIESKDEDIPSPIGSHLERWVAGCDICQEVCPWNADVSVSALPEFAPSDWRHKSKAELLRLSEMEHRGLFKKSSFSRIKRSKFHRTLEFV